MGHKRDYIHGYGRQESDRLLAQASSVLDLLHADTSYPAGARVLEVGCGTGAQTVTLAHNSPDAHIVSFDRSAVSLAQARDRAAAAGVSNVEFLHGDLFALPFAPQSFDHAFVCFVLEHLSNPVDALIAIKHLLAPGGTITVFEGDHGSAYFHPDSAVARRAIACQVELQRRAGGNACIGRQLYPLLTEADYVHTHVSPRVVYWMPRVQTWSTRLRARRSRGWWKAFDRRRSTPGSSTRRRSTRAFATCIAPPNRTACSATRFSKPPQ